MASRKKRSVRRNPEPETIVQIAVSTMGSYEEPDDGGGAFGEQTPVVFALTEAGCVYMMHTDEEDPVWARLPDIIEGEDEEDEEDDDD